MEGAITSDLELIDFDNCLWRAFKYISCATSYTKISTNAQASEIGKGLGLFHYSLKDFPSDSLNKILPDLHNTSKYLATLDHILESHRCPIPKDETSSLNKAITKAKMPKEVEKKCLQELKKLKNMSPMSAEATVVRNYLDWMTELPWHKKSEVDIDLKLSLIHISEPTRPY